MNLNCVVKALENLAPLHLAAKWDNVGLLVEPSPPHTVKNVLLTNDLTEGVMKEAIKYKTDLIVSYHPPLFRPLKQITNKSWKERLIIKALENRIAIYSPHTACDAVRGGVNDWLSKSLGELQKSDPIELSNDHRQFKLVKIFSNSEEPDLLSLCKDLCQKYKLQVKNCNDNSEIEVICGKSDVENVILGLPDSPSLDVKIIDVCAQPLFGFGMGRLCYLQKSTKIKDLVASIKSHLTLKNVRVAFGNERSIDDFVNTVALCAGAGSSVLRGVKADVYLTGEMSHHDVLDAVSHNITVILCEHSNTERGFLCDFKTSLLNELSTNEVEVHVSEVDKDPLCVF